MRSTLNTRGCLPPRVHCCSCGRRSSWCLKHVSELFLLDHTGGKVECWAQQEADRLLCRLCLQPQNSGLSYHWFALRIWAATCADKWTRKPESTKRRKHKCHDVPIATAVTSRTTYSSASCVCLACLLACSFFLAPTHYGGLATKPAVSLRGTFWIETKDEK